jgi:hypothetical protein
MAMAMGWILVSAVFESTAQGQIVFGQVDDFDSSLEGWDFGAASPSSPMLVANAGPAGSGDNAMQITSFGGSGPGRTPVVLNNSQWADNYLGQGVTSITLNLRNTGATDLRMRLAFRGPDSITYFATTFGFDLSAGGSWQNAQFSLAEGSLTRIQGSQSYATVFGNVSEMRILHSASPNFRGDSIAATVLVDNITAVPEPGSTGVVLALAAALTAVVVRRRSTLPGRGPEEGEDPIRKGIVPSTSSDT